MKKSIIEVIKSNKGVIAKKSLIIGGILAGLYLAGAALSSSEDEILEINTDEDTVSEVEEEVAIVEESKVIDLEEKR